MPDSKDYTAGMQAHNSMALSVLNVTSDTVFDKGKLIETWYINCVK